MSQLSLLPTTFAEPAKDSDNENDADAETLALNPQQHHLDDEDAGPTSYAAAAKAAIEAQACRARVVDALKLVAVCVGYTVFGPSVIVANDIIMKGQHFKFPMLLSVFGLIASSLFSAVVLHARWRCPQRTKQRPEVTRDTLLRTMLPIGVAQAITFAAGNAAYMYISITFSQMLSAFTPTVTLVMLAALGIEQPTVRVTASVVGLSIGCLIASWGVSHFSVPGAALRLLGIFAEATRLVLTQSLLRVYNLDVIETQYYLSPIGACTLLIGALFFEVPRFIRHQSWLVILEKPMRFAASAIFGLLASLMTFTIIKLANSVTLKILNTMRNAFFVTFTIVVLGEEATRTQVVGYCISLLAFVFYTYFKMYGK